MPRHDQITWRRLSSPPVINETDASDPGLEVVCADWVWLHCMEYGVLPPRGFVLAHMAIRHPRKMKLRHPQTTLRPSPQPSATAPWVALDCLLQAQFYRLRPVGVPPASMPSSPPGEREIRSAFGACFHAKGSCYLCVERAASVVRYLSPIMSSFRAISRLYMVPIVSLRPWALAAILVLLVACSAPQVRTTQVLGQNDRYVVLVAGEGETPASLAKEFLGDALLGWRVEDANGGDTIRPGQQVVIPLQPDNRTGVFPSGYQTVPVLSYHRFGAGRGKLSVAKHQFEEQMQYLKQHGYRVVPLKAVLDFVRGQAVIPQRSVVITIDDGYKSVYEIAFPVLKKYGYPATIFIYTDYIGNGGLTWRQMEEMEASGLISFQAHSKTHDNLTMRLPSESIGQYKKRIAGEVRIPAELLSKRMKDSMLSYAYPFGAVNQPVVDELKKSGYQSGVTVDRGGNAFFTYPYALRRSMIYETDGIEEFKQALRVFEDKDLR